MLTSWRVRRAKRILEKFEKKEASKKNYREEKALEEKRIRDIHTNLIKGFGKRYLDEMTNVFSSLSEPEFSEGEEVLINWYATGNSWEGNIRSNLSHMNKEIGPMNVIVSKPFVDTTMMYEEIHEKMSNNLGLFDYFNSEDNYDEFAYIVNKWRRKYSNVPWIWHAYAFKSLDEKIKLPTYSLSENNFLKIGSGEEKIIKELWDMECESKRLQREIDNHHILIKSLNEKSEALRAIGGKFYIGPVNFNIY